VGCVLIGGCKKSTESETSSHIQQVEKRLSEALQTIEAVRQEKEQVEHDWRKVSDALSDLQTKYDEVISVLEDVQQNMEQLRQERDNAQARLQRALEGMDALEELAQDKTERVRQLEQENTQLQNVIEALESQVTAFTESESQDQFEAVDDANDI
jgi:chromosome segregation ATPase